VTTEDTSIHLTLMMMTEMDIETSVYHVHLKRLIAREDYIKLIMLIFSFFRGAIHGISGDCRKQSTHVSKRTVNREQNQITKYIRECI
jgi:hypothetical protein